MISVLYHQKIDALKLNDNVNTLILGDSHPQCALNDSLFKNSVNFSINAENYLFTYNVLKVIVKNNPQIRNLIMGFSFHNISAYYEKYLFDEKYSEDDFSKSFYSRYFPILDNESKLFLVKKNLPSLIRSSQSIVSNMIKSITQDYTNYQEYPFIGKYYPGKGRALNDSLIKQSIRTAFYADSTGTELEDISALQKEYLKAIILFCKENNIKLILLNTPLHEKYFVQIPVKFISEYYSLLNELKKNENVTVLDYYDFKLPDEYFGDGTHLNLLGASVFTPEIMHRLNGN